MRKILILLFFIPFIIVGYVFSINLFSNFLPSIAESISQNNTETKVENINPYKFIIQTKVSFAPSLVRHEWYGTILELEPKVQADLSLFNTIHLPLYSYGVNFIYVHIAFLFLIILLTLIIILKGSSKEVSIPTMNYEYSFLHF